MKENDHNPADYRMQRDAEVLIFGAGVMNGGSGARVYPEAEQEIVL